MSASQWMRQTITGHKLANVPTKQSCRVWVQIFQNLKGAQPQEEVDGGEGKVEVEEEHQEEPHHQQLHEELHGGVDCSTGHPSSLMSQQQVKDFS